MHAKNKLTSIDACYLQSGMLEKVYGKIISE